jgi:MerR family transcriptional regulator, light-induced transcriptional regulator
MNSTNSHHTGSETAFLAAILSRSARALSSDAALRLLDKDPAAGAGFGNDPFVGWQQWLVARLEEMTAALSLQRSDLFPAQVQWARSALIPRGIDVRHFRDAMLLLRKVLEEELPEQVRSMAFAYFDPGLEVFDRPEPCGSGVGQPSGVFSRLTAEYLLAVLEGNGRRASQLVLQAVDQGHSVENLYLHVLEPAQAEIGRLWLANEISIAEEHLSSATVRRLMSQLIGQTLPRPPVGKTVLTAAVAGNRHDLGTQAVADFFEIDGWRTVHLGADVPAEALLEVLELVAVDLLALSAALAVQLPAMRDAIVAVRGNPHCQGLKILVGGQVIGDSQELARQLGADACAADAQQAVGLGRRLVGLE